MRRRLASLALLLVLALAARAETDEMIYPRGTAPAGAARPAAPAPGGSNPLFLLGVAAVAAAAGWWLWQKRRTSLHAAGGSRLNVVETKSLGSRQYLVVADYDGRKFLLGVCPGSIEMLTPLDGGSPPAK